MAYRILIVDDSPAMRAFIRRVLDISGMELGECFEAANGRDALDLLAREWVDAILTDVSMPQMDGETFLSELARRELLRAIPVIVVSTDATRPRMERMLAMGAKGYIAKPFLPEDLRNQLERTLGVAHG